MLSLVPYWMRNSGSAVVVGLGLVLCILAYLKVSEWSECMRVFSFFTCMSMLSHNGG